MSTFPIGKSITTTITSGLTGLPTALVEYIAATTPQLKPVESTAPFQKTREQVGGRELSHENLRYTFCNANDYTLRPYGNLFQTFRLPTNLADSTALQRAFAGTALAKLANITKAISIEIPRNKYGEMLDGKTIELTIPQKADGSFYSVTCYSNFYNFNPDLNTQVSDANPISSLFSGVEPTIENEFNTNIAYLFSNAIATPKDSLITSEVIPSRLITLGPDDNYGMNDDTNTTISLLAGKNYTSNILAFTSNLVTTVHIVSLGVIPFADAVEYVNVNGFKLKYNIDNIIFDNRTRDLFSRYFYVSESVAGSTRQWSTWSTQNRFPAIENGAGKVCARLTDANTQVLIDEPVGIAYLDKGFIVITHPTLINNFDLSDAFYTDENGVDQPYSQAPEDATKFTNIFFRTSDSGFNRSVAKFNSVVTEYNQGYTCLAMPNEFYESTNASYRQAYPSGSGNAGQQSVQITELGLYNKFGELIAIAKTTKPIEKTKSSVAVFTVGLKI